MKTPIWLVAAALLGIISRSNSFGYLTPERDARSVSSGDSNSTMLYPNGLSIFEALRNLNSDGSLILMSGTYKLEQYTLVSNLNNICISGRGDVIITCSENVGLAFLNITDFVIDGVRIEGCGLSGPNLDHALSEIRQFIDLFFVVYSEMRVALLIGHCENLRMDGVEITSNVGFGLVGVNVIGVSIITRLNVTNNTQPSGCELDPSISTTDRLVDPERYGGGVVFIYQDYLPRYRELYDDRFYEITIEEATFKQNTGCSYGYLNFFLFQDPVFVRYMIGGGGGLTLLVSQLNYGMQIVTRDSYFEENRATVGSAVHIALFSGTRNTLIEFYNCEFVANGITQAELDTFQTVGGAGLGITTGIVRPLNEQITPPHVFHNLNTSIRVQSSRFLRNVVPFGAGIYYYSLLKSAVSNLTDVVYFYIKDCQFNRNSAYLGSAMQVWELKFHGAYPGTQFQLIDTTITQNAIVTTDANGAQSILQSTGVVDIRYMNMTMHGNCVIKENFGTALRAESSLVGIVGNVTFNSNIGIRGGAMFLTTYTYLIVLSNASLYLLNNIARDSGGAIYSNFLGLNSYIIGGSSNCFLAFNYHDIGLCGNCSDLEGTGSFIKFEGNSAPAGGQVFGSAFQSCPWAIDLLLSLNKPLNTSVVGLIAEQFPTVFSFDTPTSGPEYFRTQAQTLSIVDPVDATVFDVSPGQVFNITLVAEDNFQQIVSNVISSFVETNRLELFRNVTPNIGTNNLGLLRDNVPTELSLSVSGMEGRNVSVVIFSTDLIGRARTEITVNLGQCGQGFAFNTESLTCVCIEELETLGISCETDNQILTSPRNLWVGPVDGILGVAECPLLYCEFNVIPISQGADFDVQCDSRLFRRGVVCGDCQEGRSFVLGTSRCMECSNISVFLFPMFLILGFILTLVIYYLDMSIALGLLNGAIFFSNLVTIYGEFLFPGSLGGANFIFIVSFLSLNFGIESCLYNGMRGLDRIWWQLSFPLYLLVLMIFIVCLARTKYLRGVKYNDRLSPARAFTTLLILCYVSVLQVSAQLFGFITVQAIDGSSSTRWILEPSVVYFSSGHAPLMLISVIISIGYLIPFPLLLLFPNLIFKSRFLKKLKPLYDAFWHPFEPKFRFWLGFRLIFRWIPFLLTFIAPPPINIFVTDIMILLLLFVQLTLKPFKNNWINIIDSVFLCLLVIMFTGSLFFVASAVRDNGFVDEYRTTIYNKVLTVIAFCLILGIFFYHLKIRFPKLEAFTNRVWHKLKKGERKENIIEQELNSSTTWKEPPTYTIVTTDLRESLLEDDNFVAVIPTTDRCTS